MDDDFPQSYSALLLHFSLLKQEGLIYKLLDCFPSRNLIGIVVSM
jgi:hypothetical protein